MFIHRYTRTHIYTYILYFCVEVTRLCHYLHSNAVPHIFIFVTPLTEKIMSFVILIIDIYFSNPPFYNQPSIATTRSFSVQMLSPASRTMAPVLCGHTSQLLANLPLVRGCPLHLTQVLTLCSAPLPCTEAFLAPLWFHGARQRCPMCGHLAHPVLALKLHTRPPPMHRCLLHSTQALTHANLFLHLATLFMPLKLEYPKSGDFPA